MSAGEEEIVIVGGGGQRPKSADFVMSVYDQLRLMIDQAEADGTNIRWISKGAIKD